MSKIPRRTRKKPAPQSWNRLSARWRTAPSRKRPARRTRIDFTERERRITFVLQDRGAKGATLPQIASWQKVSKPQAKRIMDRLVILRGFLYYKGKYYSPNMILPSKVDYRQPAPPTPTQPIYQVLPPQPAPLQRVWVKLTARFDYDDEDHPLHIELSREIEVLRGQEEQAKALLASLMEQWVDFNYGPMVSRNLQFGEPRYEATGSTGMLVRQKRGATQPWQQRLLV